MRKRRAIVVGGSLGGLFAANMLREVCHWDVDVYERVENDLAARGAGIATHDEMFHVMMESPSVVAGRVALLGDAAFVARPHVGMGTTKAALDARYLADALLGKEGDLSAALREYDAAVRKFGTRAVARGRWLGAHLAAQVTKPRAQRTEHELHHMPLDKLFREVGAALTDVPELAELT